MHLVWIYLLFFVCCTHIRPDLAVFAAWHPCTIRYKTELLQDKEAAILSSLSITQIKPEETENRLFFPLALAYLSSSFTECSVKKCRKCDWPCRTQKGKFLWILIYCPQHCLKMLKVLRPPSYHQYAHRILRASGTLIHLVEYKSQTLFVLWRTVPSLKCFRRQCERKRVGKNVY